MAKPKLENGFTPIANEILEKLARMHLSANQWQVLLCIIRKTYGFHKKVDYIANKQIGDATGLGKTVVSRVLHNLEDIKLITRKGKYIGFQKDWEMWEGLSVQLTFEPKEPPKMRIIRADGYIGIWREAVEPEYQVMATQQGYILEHRLIMARLQGRPLESWEVVHHKGTKYPLGSLEDKGDNREDNLELLPSQADHMPSILAQQRIKKLEAELAVLRTKVDDNEGKQNGQPKLAKSTVKSAKQSTKVSSSEATQKIKETTTKDTIQKKEDLSRKFKLFWTAYPKKVAKADAEKRFNKINPDEQLLKTMMASIDRAKKSEGWLKDDGKFIPHPATWLNGRRWEDEIKGASHGENRGHPGSRKLPKKYRTPEQIYGEGEKND